MACVPEPVDILRCGPRMERNSATWRSRVERVARRLSLDHPRSHRHCLFRDRMPMCTGGPMTSCQCQAARGAARPCHAVGGQSRRGATCLTWTSPMPVSIGPISLTRNLRNANLDKADLAGARLMRGRSRWREFGACAKSRSGSAVWHHRRCVDPAASSSRSSRHLARSHTQRGGEQPKQQQKSVQPMRSWRLMSWI